MIPGRPLAPAPAVHIAIALPQLPPKAIIHMLDIPGPLPPAIQEIALTVFGPIVVSCRIWSLVPAKRA